MPDTTETSTTATEPANTVTEDEGHRADPADTSPAEDAPDAEPDTFPRAVVEKLRSENARYRQRAHHADTLAARLHTELVRATGRLADPTDLPFDPAHLDDPDALAAAVDQLLADKPHLGTRRPTGDIGQGNRGPAPASFSLLDALRERT